MVRILPTAREQGSDLHDELWGRFGSDFATLSTRIFALEPWAQNSSNKNQLESAISEMYSRLDPVARFHLTSSKREESPTEFSLARFIVAHSSVTVELSQDIWTQEMGRVILHRMVFTLPIIAKLRSLLRNRRGTFTLGLGDSTDRDDVGFCSNSPDCLLIPDSDFLGTGGHLLFRQYVANLWIDWEDREPIVFWRGSATGIPRQPGTFDFSREPFKFLPRLELCARMQKLAHCDAGITAPELIPDEHVRRLAEESLRRPRVERTDQIRFRHLIEIDGMSNAWSAAFTAMVMGSCILKVASPMRFQQWYSPRRVAWKHYIPISSDLGDLEEKVEWALRHPRQAKRIAANGGKLARQLTYTREVELAAKRLAARFCE
jgi:Glycosyl transferase family 90